jgi:hypothetical protein
MPTWGWIVIAVGAVAALLAVAWIAFTRQRTRRLRTRFGPEYDRALDSAESKREAEADLSEREQRREQQEIRPLSTSARERYVISWRETQARFVDDPSGAVAACEGLIQSAMAERGYPVADFDQRAADLSVDHPTVVENYRESRRLMRQGETEDLRQAMRHQRALFDELVGDVEDESPAVDRQQREGHLVT